MVPLSHISKLRSRAWRLASSGLFAPEKSLIPQPEEHQLGNNIGCRISFGTKRAPQIQEIGFNGSQSAGLCCTGRLIPDRAPAQFFRGALAVIRKLRARKFAPDCFRAGL